MKPILDQIVFLIRLQLAERLARLGVPDDAPQGFISIPAGRGPSRQAIVLADPHPPWLEPWTWPECPPCRIDLAGVVKATIPEVRDYPYLSISNYLILEVWLATARLENGRADAGVSFGPNARDVDIGLSFGRWRDDDITEISRAVRWMETIHRPRGPAAMSDEEAFEEAVSLGLEWLTDHAGQPPSAFGVRELAQKRVKEVSSTRGWMKDKRVSIRRVQRELSRRIPWLGETPP